MIQKHKQLFMNTVKKWKPLLKNVIVVVNIVLLLHRDAPIAFQPDLKTLRQFMGILTKQKQRKQILNYLLINTYLIDLIVLFCP